MGTCRVGFGHSARRKLWLALFCSGHRECSPSVDAWLSPQDTSERGHTVELEWIFHRPFVARVYVYGVEKIAQNGRYVL